LKFSIFIKNIENLKKASLGGIDSQFKMAPAVRPNISFEEIKIKKPKLSAVLALFYPNDKGETCFVLTKRATYNGVHSSQISFPGGSLEHNDKNLKYTSLRETKEEIGIDNINIIRSLTKTYIPPSNFFVSPFLGYIKGKQNFKINNEVAKVLEINLDELLDDCNLSLKQMTTSYMKNVSVPYFNLHNEVVWGATAMILSEIKDLFKAILL